MVSILVLEHTTWFQFKNRNRLREGLKNKNPQFQHHTYSEPEGGVGLGKEKGFFSSPNETSITSQGFRLQRLSEEGQKKRNRGSEDLDPVTTTDAEEDNCW